MVLIGEHAMQPDRGRAAQLGQETLRILERGEYATPAGAIIDLRSAIAIARAGTRSYPPDAPLQSAVPGRYAMRTQVTNESTLAAAHRLVRDGGRPVALNFASARHPGGGFLSGARAQEESLARSSALYACLEGNPMYALHETQRDPLYSDYAIYAPAVPVFRADDGTMLEEPYPCAFITCAAVNAKVALERDPARGSVIRAAMARRIERVLAIAAKHEHAEIILGAWGCGVFGNDPGEIAGLFKEAFEGPYRGCFAAVVFAILDWSAERRFIGPFERAFAG
jgi:uncharacterized protein (TIGR02452 family)